MKHLLGLLLSVALCAVSPARACEFCGSPDQARAPSGLGALYAPFDAASFALTRSELDFLTTLEGGRYRPEANHLLDSRQAPARPLTLAEVLELLSKRSELAAAGLEGARGPFSEEQKREALHLYWNRGVLLSEERRDFLEAALKAQFGTIPKVFSADWAQAAPAAPAPALPAAAPAAAGAVPAAVGAAPRKSLLERLRERAQLLGSPQERQALDRLLEKMLESPTARRLSEKLLEEGRNFELAFEDIPNSVVYTENGVKKMKGSGGHTQDYASPVKVVLNRLYLQTGPLSAEAAGTLAHELLGHARQTFAALRLGARDAYHYYDRNEEHAGVVGWLVELELGRAAEDSNMLDYMADPSGYLRGLKTNLFYYATTLSLSEIDQVPQIFTDRIEAAKAALAELEAGEGFWGFWFRVVKHQIQKHNRDPGSFRQVAEYIGNVINASIPTHRKNIEEIRDRLKSDTLPFYQGPNGQAVLAQMRAHPSFFNEVDREIGSLRDAIAARLRTMPRTPPIVWEAGQITLEQLYQLHYGDKCKDKPVAASSR